SPPCSANIRNARALTSGSIFLGIPLILPDSKGSGTKPGGIQVEDSPTGYRSAIAAGCHVIVLNLVARPATVFPDAELITESPIAAAQYILETRGQQQT
ncbi:hypothetical protein ABLE92_23925, partial [Gordonia sp. VNQ95]|uniref:hypothetical protein n=1 Tax=Gordonia sp. VNQ95 TaxID=3156619 RepID=UPI0032B3C1C3